MAKTQMIGTFKMAGELSDANMAVRMACSVIHEAEQAGQPISRGDLVDRVCYAYTLPVSSYTWLGSPGPKSPIGTLWDREKGPDGNYVMRMLPLGMQFVGTHMKQVDFMVAKRRALWDAEGVYEVVKVGDLFKVRNWKGEVTAATVIEEGRHGWMVLGLENGDVGFHPGHFHKMECDGNCDGGKSVFISSCLGAKKKKKKAA